MIARRSYRAQKECYAVIQAVIYAETMAQSWRTWCRLVEQALEGADFS